MARYTRNDIRHDMETKSMWAGALEPSDIKEMLIMYGHAESMAQCKQVSVVQPKQFHTPALLKIIDEIIANALDHVFYHGNKYPVTRIEVTINTEGVISVFNDGPGISIVEDVTADGKGRIIYIPESIFSSPLFGSSDADRATGKSIKAGINALGAKICNVHSTYFKVETADINTQLTYSQEYDTIYNPLVPIIKSVVLKPCDTYTRITFKPNYKRLCKVDILAELTSWIRYRMHLAAMFVGRAKVYFNGKLVITDSSNKFAQLTMPNCTYHSTEVAAAGIEWKWDLTIAVFKEDANVPTYMRTHVAIVNGVLTPRGNHITYITTAIRQKLTELLIKIKGKNTDMEDIKKEVSKYQKFYKIIVTMGLPGADWSAQTKDELTNYKDRLLQYKIPDAFTNSIAETIIGTYLINIDTTTKFVITPKAKYKPAKFSSRVETARLCTLIIMEGDSAGTMINAGLGSNNRVVSNVREIVSANRFSATVTSYEWYGSISIQGVPLNVHDEFYVYNGKRIRSVNINENERLNNIKTALGLNYDKTYETVEEMATLKYGRILLCTDEDLDGVGKIAPLILVYIYKCWPNLIKNGYVYRMKTPLLRIGDLEFYTMEEYLEYNKQHTKPKQCKVKYYKGLAAHGDADIKRMFSKENFSKQVYRYTVADMKRLEELFHIFYGSESEERKIVLSMPNEPLPLEYIKRASSQNIISLEEEQFNMCKVYKKDAVERQIPHILDGLNPSRRKIVYTAESSLTNDPVKVLVFSASVVTKTGYHKGDTSLNHTVIYLAQDFINGRYYPMLGRDGQFGDRHGEEAGAPRYIQVMRGKWLHKFFVEDDKPLYTHVDEDGMVAEFTNYVPVLPLHILETSFAVSEGWSNTTYGRDLDDVINVIKVYIETYNGGILREISDELYEHRLHTRTNKEGFNKACARAGLMSYMYKLRLNASNFKGRVETYIDTTGKRRQMSIGLYTIKGNRIEITELPINVKTNEFMNNFIKPTIEGTPNARMRQIESYFVNNSASEVCIEIILKAGSMKYIDENYGNEVLEPLEHFLGIYDTMAHNLNFYSPNDTVLEFGDNYLAALLYWIRFRVDLYAVRVRRQHIILQAQLMLASSIIRYIDEYKEIDLSHLRDEEEACAVLSSRGYKRFNTAIIAKPPREVDSYLSLIHEGSYKYLLDDIRTSDLFEKSKIARKQKLIALQREFDKYTEWMQEKPIGKTLWLSEINDFKRN